MSSIFEDVQRKRIVNGEIVGLEIERKEITIQNPSQLETYGESKLRGFGRSIVRKAPIVARDIISTGKRTITPALRDAGKSILKAGLKVGKAQFDDLRKRKAKGINVWW